MREIKAPADLELFGDMPLTVIIPIEGWDCVTERALRLAVQISDDITAVYVCAQPNRRAVCQRLGNVMWSRQQKKRESSRPV